MHIKSALWIASTLATAMLWATAAPLTAETRDYNPVRRASANEELPAPPRSVGTPPMAAPSQTWTPPVSGPPGQWRSMRQPGPMQLPAPQYMPSRTVVQQQQPAAAAPASPITEDVSPEEASGNWPDGAPGPGNHACHGPNCGCGDNCSCGDHCGCGDGCCDGGCGGGCGGCCLGGCFHGCWLWPQSWEVFGGVHGFKGPPDRGNNGNFGFQEGFNLGGVLKPAFGISYQFGAQFLQSDLSGDSAVVDRTDSRQQSFVTAGLFHRSCGCGFQGGVVWDWLHDDYYVTMNLSQIRGELGFVMPWSNEFGFWFAAGIGDDEARLFGTREIWQVTDLYAFYYRKYFGCGGQARLWAGWTGRSDGIVGGDLSVPLSNCWALQTNFNYLIPDENGVASIPEEGWSLAINLVWYPGCTATCISPCRPLFNVADNATFMVDRRGFAQTAQ